VQREKAHALLAVVDNTAWRAGAILHLTITRGSTSRARTQVTVGDVGNGKL